MTCISALLFVVAAASDAQTYDLCDGCGEVLLASTGDGWELLLQTAAGDHRPAIRWDFLSTATPRVSWMPDPALWQEHNAGLLHPDNLNPFHAAQRGAFTAEFEALEIGEARLYVESAYGYDSWIGWQEGPPPGAAGAGSHYWSLGQRSADTALVLARGFGLGDPKAVFGPGGDFALGVSTPGAALDIRRTGDAQIRLWADTDNVDESDNAALWLSQDGGMIQGVLGYVGDSGASPLGTGYAGAAVNALLLGTLTGGSHQTLQLGTDGAVRVTIDNAGRVHLSETLRSRSVELLSPNGECWALTVADGGDLQTEPCQ